MPERYDYFPAVALGVFFLLIAAVVAFGYWRRRKTQEREREEAEKKAEEGIAQGVLARDPVTGDVYARCIICGGRAVTCAPTSGSSWMDRLPLLNRLFGLPPRYTIIDDIENGPQYCKIHKDVAVKKLEQFHAALRAERSRFNAEQADKVAQMDAGGLQQIVTEQHKEAVAVLERRREKSASVPLLPPPAAPSTKQVFSTMTTTHEEEEEPRPRLEVVGGRG